jgi:hypothetical protein
MSAASWGRPRLTSTPLRVRGGHSGRHPVTAKTRKSNSHLSKTWRLGECSLTSRWRSPASSSLGARRALWQRPTSPPPHPSRLRGACWHLCGARRLSHGPLGGGRSRACPRHCLLSRLRDSGRGGCRIPPLGESSPPVSLHLLRRRRRILRGCRERVPAARAAETPHSSIPGALAAVSSSPSCAPPAPSPAAALCTRALRLGAWAGRITWRPWSPAAGDERRLRPRRRLTDK